MKLPDHAGGWQWTTVADLATDRPHSLVIGPFGSDLLASDFVDEGVPVVFVRNVRPLRFRPDVRRFITRDKAETLAAHRVSAGDLVITIMGTPPCIAALYPDSEPPGIVTADVIKLTPNIDAVDHRYLAHYLNSKVAARFVQRFTFGVTRPKVTLRDFKALPVPLPQLPEQHRIVDILDKADAIRRKRQDTITLAQEFLHSAFLDMFGDPVTNPRGWPVEAVADCIEAVESGWSAQGEERITTEGEWGVLKVSAVTSGRFRPVEHKAVTKPRFAKPPVIPRRGDLLFSRANTRELVAATCLVEETQEKLFLPDKLWRITCDSSVATAEYMRFLLANRHFRTRLARRATGTSGSMLNVSQAKLLAMQAPMPPLSVQQEFGSIVWAAYGLDGRQEVARVQAGELLHSLAQRAFRGELSSKEGESG